MRKVEQVYYYPKARRFIAEMVSQHNPCAGSPDEVESMMKRMGDEFLEAAKLQDDGNYYGGTLGFMVEVQISEFGNAFMSYALEGNIIMAGQDRE